MSQRHIILKKVCNSRFAQLEARAREAGFVLRRVGVNKGYYMEAGPFVLGLRTLNDVEAYLHKEKD